MFLFYRFRKGDVSCDAWTVFPLPGFEREATPLPLLAYPIVSLFIGCVKARPFFLRTFPATCYLPDFPKKNTTVLRCVSPILSAVQFLSTLTGSLVSLREAPVYISSPSRFPASVAPGGTKIPTLVFYDLRFLVWTSQVWRPPLPCFFKRLRLPTPFPASPSCSAFPLFVSRYFPKWEPFDGPAGARFLHLAFCLPTFRAYCVGSPPSPSSQFAPLESIRRLRSRKDPPFPSSS